MSPHKLAPPPDNLPLDPLDFAHGTSDAYLVTTEDVVRLRQALIQDVGYDGAWTEAEIREMARSTLSFLRTLFQIAEAQRARELPI